MAHNNQPASTEALFREFTLGGLRLANRIVMVPMTRNFSPGGVPGADVADYYRRRAEAGVGLIMTEGTYIAHPSSGRAMAVPRFQGGATIDGWTRVAEAVHQAGGRIFPQIWHVGLSGRPPGPGVDADVRLRGPSGLWADGTKDDGGPLTVTEIEDLVEAYGTSAALARERGFDGIEIHAAHGYCIDQFFWAHTNRRDDAYGGGITERSRFGAQVIAECRRATAPDFPICVRISQWKLGDMAARLVHSPDQLAQFLAPLSEAGADMFHCSTLKFWEPEFEGSDLNLAGWARKLTGKPAITVGSVNGNTDTEPRAVNNNAADVAAMVARDEFDLVAVGRALIANPGWAEITKRGAFDELVPFDNETVGEILY